jgi:hypothetical protein
VNALNSVWVDLTVVKQNIENKWFTGSIFGMSRLATAFAFLPLS